MSLFTTYEGKQFQMKGLSGTTTMSRVLEAGCKHFKLDPALYELKNKSSVMDPSLSLRFARLPHGTKLSIIRVSNLRLKKMKDMKVTIALQAKGSATSQLEFKQESTLWDVLIAFEEKNEANYTDWTGVPDEPIEEGPFVLHINVPGYMQPVVTFLNTRIETNDELKSSTLQSLGINNGGRAKLRLTHQYTKPSLTEEERKKTLDNFKQSFDERFQQQQRLEAAVRQQLTERTTSSSSSLSELKGTDSKTEKKKKASGHKSLIPQNRGKRVFKTPPSFNPRNIPFEDDDFYERTHADSVLYAKSIRIQAAVDRLKNGKRSPDESSKLSRDYHVCTVRVRLTQGLYLEGKFKAVETIGHLRKFVRESLNSDIVEDFTLYLTPPKQVFKKENDDRTFRQSRLLPSAIVSFTPQYTQAYLDQQSSSSPPSQSSPLQFPLLCPVDQKLVQIIEVEQPTEAKKNDNTSNDSISRSQDDSFPNADCQTETETAQMEIDSMINDQTTSTSDDAPMLDV